MTAVARAFPEPRVGPAMRAPGDRSSNAPRAPVPDSPRARLQRAEIFRHPRAAHSGRLASRLQRAAGSPTKVRAAFAQTTARLLVMSAQASQALSGMIPAAIKRANSLQPRQKPRKASNEAATMMAATRA